jgi:hypothetical protein
MALMRWFPCLFSLDKSPGSPLTRLVERGETVSTKEVVGGSEGHSHVDSR